MDLKLIAKTLRAGAVFTSKAARLEAASTVEAAGKELETLRAELAVAQQKLEAQQLAYRAMVSDYQHVANALHALEVRVGDVPA